MTTYSETTAGGYLRTTRRRNLVLGGVLVFFAVLFYAITIVRM